MLNARLLPLLIAVALHILIPQLAWAECPESSPELMRHFGRSLLPADQLALTVRDGDLADRAKFAAAIAGLGRAIECGRIAAGECGLALLPPRLRDEPGPYRALMAQFISTLEKYRGAIAEQAVSNQPVDLGLVRKIKDEVRGLVNQAHERL